MWERYEIKKYLVWMNSSRDTGSIVFNFYDANSKYIGGLICSDYWNPLPKANRTAAGAINLYYRMRDYPALIDLLRNESPLYLVWGDEYNSCITSSSEPVGEGEIPHP